MAIFADEYRTHVFTIISNQISHIFDKFRTHNLLLYRISYGIQTRDNYGTHTATPYRIYDSQ